MIDVQPAPVPELSDEWITSHQTALVSVLSQRRRKPLRWVALAGATAVAATVGGLVLVGGSEQSAFAGWSPSPTPPASGQLTSADAGCQVHFAQVPPSSNNGGRDASLVPELSDVRGPYTVTVFGDGTASGALLCVTTPDGNSAVRWLMQSGAPVSTGAVAVDQIAVLARDSQRYTLVEGRTGNGVTGVDLVLGNGSKVTATSGNGVFVAWWPGSESITAAIVSTTSGVSTQNVNLPGPGIPSSPKTPPPSPPGTQSSCVPNANVACSVVPARSS
jgi:hypothetical protein